MIKFCFKLINWYKYTTQLGLQFKEGYAIKELIVRNIGNKNYLFKIKRSFWDLIDCKIPYGIRVNPP